MLKLLCGDIYDLNLYAQHIDQMLVWVYLVLYLCHIKKKKKWTLSKKWLSLLPNFLLTDNIIHYRTRIVPVQRTQSGRYTHFLVFAGSTLTLHLFIKYTSAVTGVDLGKLYITENISPQPLYWEMAFNFPCLFCLFCWHVKKNQHVLCLRSYCVSFFFYF